MENIFRDVSSETKRQLEDLLREAKAGGSGSVLFTGPRGTGKPLAAEVIAREIGRGLLTLDLAAIPDGEAETQLEHFFDAAEAGAVLLLENADKIFGKRTEPKGSNDRSENQWSAYLLQRLESYRGWVILTTNLKDAIDPAFVRRLRLVIDFSW